MRVLIKFPNLNSSLDKEHREIIEFLIELENNKRSINSVGAVVNKYLDKHMLHEEEFMEEIGYPDLLARAHKAEHDQMKLFFHSKIDSNDKIELIRDCFVTHINKFDGLLAEWVKKNVK